MAKKILALLTITTNLVKMELPFFKKVLPPKPQNCQQYTSQLISLFTLMCDNISNGEDNASRDACVGCFQRSSTSNNNQPSLSNLNDCAEIYIPDTRYDACAGLIDTGTATPAPGACVAGYCRFVTCVRRVNSNLLIAQCYEQAAVGNEAIFEEDQISLIKDTVSCILARTRCGNVNPITGQHQNNRITTTIYDKWGKPQNNAIPLYNSLQITPENDLRIVNFPGTTKIQNYFCRSQPNLKESSWLEFSC